MKSLFIGKSHKLHVQLFRYGFVAAVAFIIDFGLLYVFTTKFGLFYLLSATLSFSISLYVNYLLSTVWVFPNSELKKAVQITGFLVIGLVGLVLNLLIIGLLTSLFKIYYLDSKLIAIIIVFIWSFIARRFLFKDRTKKTSKQV